MHKSDLELGINLGLSLEVAEALGTFDVSSNALLLLGLGLFKLRVLRVGIEEEFITFLRKGLDLFNGLEWLSALAFLFIGLGLGLGLFRLAL